MVTPTPRTYVVKIAVGYTAAVEPTAGAGGDVTVVETRLPEIATRRAQGETIGRYVVVEVLGAGGMGVVYRVYDPKLDREAALKLVQVAAKKGSLERRARLLREAQSLAQLSHPNVVAVYDVGVVDDELYIAMEYVQGVTLKRWLQGGHHWRKILELFIEAARGLAAAHAQGIIHRDFKLDNVLVSHESSPGARARVLDFGLARPVQGAVTATVEGTLESQEVALAAAAKRLSTQLTDDGLVMGTPKTMSPEQHAGKVADERADQFSFCATLFEALFGKPPYRGRTVHELSHRKLRGQIAAIPSSSRVPPRVRRAVLRGLEAKAKDRWPSMGELIEELEAGTRRRWPRAVAAVAVVAVAGGFIATYAAGADSQCDAEELTQPLWNAERHATVQTAFEATELPYASDTWERTDRLLDRHLARWSSAYEEACLAQATGSDASAELDRRMLCVRQDLEAIGALLELFAEADRDVVEHAVQGVAALPAPARCKQIGGLALRAAPPHDEAALADIRAIRELLTRAVALRRAGKYDEGLALADTSYERAKALSYPPVEAEARVAVGELLARRGKLAKAETALAGAYHSAQAAGDDPVSARAAILLVRLSGAELARPEDGRLWARHAEAALARLGVAPQLRAQLASNRAAVAKHEARYDDALALCEEALAIREEALGPEHPAVAASLAEVATVKHELGFFDEATSLLRRSLAVREAALGPDHPDVAQSAVALGRELYIQGEGEEAVQQQRRSLAIREKALGPDHIDVAESLDNLGRALVLVGRFDEALEVQTRALAIREDQLGPDHVEVAASLGSIGLLLHNQSRFNEALQYQARSLAIREKALGTSHPHVAMALINMGFDYEGLEEHHKALKTHLHALEIATEALGKDHLLVSYPLNGIGNALIGLGRPAEAIEYQEEAVRIAQSQESDFMALGQARFGLARALWSDGKQRARSLAVGREAQASFAKAGVHGDAMREQIRGWLAERQ